MSITERQYPFHTYAVQAAVLCGATNIFFVGGRLQLSCGRLGKVCVLIAVDTVPSRYSRYVCDFLQVSVA